MAINRDKPDRWKKDIELSVDHYNDWFMKFAPKAFREERLKAVDEVEATLRATEFLTNIRPEVLRTNPGILASLRMSTCPPLARDRLIGLAKVPKFLVQRMEVNRKLPASFEGGHLAKISSIIERLADRDIFTWLGKGTTPARQEVARAATIVADRLCGATANPIIRNAQEKRQLELIGNWLKKRGYRYLPSGMGTKFDSMEPGTYAFRLNVPVKLSSGSSRTVNIPVDGAVMPKRAKPRSLPLLIEAKSAGDFTNPNKRRKEEAKKMEQLKLTYPNVSYILFLCGYFDSGYLGYEAAEGIDWVWEHRIDDLSQFGL
jgi:hypothetical protein